MAIRVLAGVVIFCCGRVKIARRAVGATEARTGVFLRIHASAVRVEIGRSPAHVEAIQLLTASVLCCCIGVEVACRHISAAEDDGRIRTVVDLEHQVLGGVGRGGSKGKSPCISQGASARSGTLDEVHDVRGPTRESEIGERKSVLHIRVETIGAGEAIRGASGGVEDCVGFSKNVSLVPVAARSVESANHQATVQSGAHGQGDGMKHAGLLDGKGLALQQPQSTGCLVEGDPFLPGTNVTNRDVEPGVAFDAGSAGCGIGRATAVAIAVRFQAGAVIRRGVRIVVARGWVGAPRAGRIVPSADSAIVFCGISSTLARAIFRQARGVILRGVRVEVACTGVRTTEHQRGIRTMEQLKRQVVIGTG